MRVIELGAVELAVASGLVLTAGGLSVGLGLGLERRLLWAGVRTVVQLGVVGYLLRWVFAVDHPALVLALAALMTVAAARAAVRRPRRRYRGAFGDAFVALLTTGLVTTAVVTQLVVGVEPWYAPRYVIPLLGMVFGNTLTGVSLCTDHLLSALDEDRATVELALSLGATAEEASRDAVREALRRGLIPIVNAMSVAGVVALPGMMTGQILAGTPPLTAVAYQVVVMFMIAGGTAVGSMIAAVLVRRRLFNARHQLRHDVISEPRA
ncbi:MAG: iron export ABC transporter permease subunit FetB [Myxococcota bacterium]